MQHHYIKPHHLALTAPTTTYHCSAGKKQAGQKVAYNSLQVAPSPLYHDGPPSPPHSPIHPHPPSLPYAPFSSSFSYFFPAFSYFSFSLSYFSSSFSYFSLNSTFTLFSFHHILLLLSAHQWQPLPICSDTAAETWTKTMLRPLLLLILLFLLILEYLLLILPFLLLMPIFLNETLRNLQRHSSGNMDYDNVENCVPLKYDNANGR